MIGSKSKNERKRFIMNRILMLSTGGTLASSHSENGLAPGLHGNDILDRFQKDVDKFMTEKGAEGWK